MTTPELKGLYNRNISLLRRAGITYQEFEHEPVLDYDAAARIRERFGLTGKETKSLFLRVKGRGYCMFMTLQGKRANLNAIKETFNAKVSVAGPDELTRQLGCMPGCAVPFGHAENIPLVIDREVFTQNRIIYSPGLPERTVELRGPDLDGLVSTLANRIIYV